MLGFAQIIELISFLTNIDSLNPTYRLEPFDPIAETVQSVQSAELTVQQLFEHTEENFEKYSRKLQSDD
jgi:hypothetical protein